MENRIKSSTLFQDRVRTNTCPEINARIDREIEDRVQFYATREPWELSSRISELESEWSIERALETEASSMGLLGLTLGLTVNRKFLLVPAVVGGMVLLHGIQGWYPLLRVFRTLGFRTREEIDREKYALKALRGDFEGISSTSGASQAQKAWRAACA
jgi:hypothetical protein